MAHSSAPGPNRSTQSSLPNWALKKGMRCSPQFTNTGALSSSQCFQIYQACQDDQHSPKERGRKRERERKEVSNGANTMLACSTTHLPWVHEDLEIQCSRYLPGAPRMGITGAIR